MSVRLRSVLFGRYWRSNPLVFSLVPRCQGEYASQKNTGIPVAVVKSACRAISLPRSQVNVQRIGAGSMLKVSMSAAITFSLLAPCGSGMAIRMRLCRSTRVTMWDAL